VRTVTIHVLIECVSDNSNITMDDAHFCIGCSKPVLDHHRAVECEDLCRRWCHIACGTGISAYQYAKAVKSMFIVKSLFVNAEIVMGISESMGRSVCRV